MKAKLLIHLASILFVSAVLLSVLVISDVTRRQGRRASPEMNGVPDLSFVDWSDPFQASLLLDVMNIYFPGRYDRNRALVAQARQERENALRDRLENGNIEEHLSWSAGGRIVAMYAKFLLVYVSVLLLTYYGVQTLGVWRFCRKKNRGGPARGPWGPRLAQIAKNCVVGAASFILFCPAYVIAYSLRTELNTDTVPFMIALCVVSNGLLMVYANKFYAFLVAESRKGYVETALAKNLNCSYGREGGITYRAICRPFKRFDGHVLGHIFGNARRQYLSTIKEQASFLITGMIITEMALNLHGYLSYELLRQMFYGNADLVVVMLLGIFLVVKATEIFTDYLVYREHKKYENA